MLLWLKTKLASNYATSDLIFIMKTGSKYLGEFRFEVLDQRNSKLIPGDVFKLMYLREGTPLYCTDLRREGMSPVNYVAGEVNGIANLRYLPCGECHKG